MRVSYRYIRPCAVLYARCTGAYATSVAQAWLDMAVWIDARHARRQVKHGYGVFHDDPTLTAPEARRYDACVELLPGAVIEADPDAGICRQTLAGGAYAVHAYTGAYEGAGELFSNLRRETVAKRGLSIDFGRPFVAIYLNDPVRTREAHRRTDLCIPVVPIRVSATSNDDGDQAPVISAAARIRA